MNRESSVLRFIFTFVLSSLIGGGYLFHLKLQKAGNSNNEYHLERAYKQISESEKMQASAAGIISAVVSEDLENRNEGAALIDPNTATEENLISLPGIGPAIAKRIIEYRLNSGKLKKNDDLLQIKGIGEKKLMKIVRHLTFQDSSEYNVRACPYCGEYTRPYMGRRVSLKPYCRNCLKYVAEANSSKTCHN